MIPELVDIGINLAHDSFRDDYAAVIAAAAEVGVTRMVVTGSSVASSRHAQALAAERPDQLRSTAGVHPHQAGELRADDLPQLQALLSQPEVVAVGECGLDYYRNYSSHADQERAFRTQLELAIETGKPLFLHQRDAHSDFLRILDAHLPQLPSAVAHCFTGTASELDDYLARGLYIGITGWICDERRGLHLRELVGRIPLNRLMVETDGPYLLPRDLRPKPAHRRNEPRFLPHIVQAIAAARGEEFALTAAGTTATARQFFGWI